MNKKFFSILVLSLVVQRAHPWCGWVKQGIRGLSDIYQVVKPEWRTTERKEYIHKSTQYQRACLRGEIPVTQGMLDKLKAAQQPTVTEGGKEESEELRKEKNEIARLEKLPHDQGGRIFSADTSDNKVVVSDVGKKDGEKGKEGAIKVRVFAMPADEPDIHRKVEGDTRILEVRWKSPFIEQVDCISYEAQTQEKIVQMHFDFFKSWRKCKRDTNLFGCYVFMKPYALAWATVMTFGAYKLYKKLGIYEKFLKPNTHGLEEDALDKA